MHWTYEQQGKKESSKSDSSSGKDSSERDKKKSSNDTSGESNEGNLDAVGNQESLGASSGKSSKEKGGGSDLKSTGDGSDQEGSTLHEQKASNVEERLLEVSGRLKDTELLNGREELLEKDKVHSVLLQLSEDVVVQSGLEEVQFPHTLDNIVLVRQRERGGGGGGGGGEKGSGRKQKT